MKQRHELAQAKIAMQTAGELYGELRDRATRIDATKQASNAEREVGSLDLTELEDDLRHHRKKYDAILEINAAHFRDNEGVYFEQAATMARADGVEIKPRIIDQLPGNLGQAFTRPIQTQTAEHNDLLFLVSGTRSLSRDLYNSRSPSQIEVQDALDQLYGLVLEVGNIALGLQQPPEEPEASIAQ